MNPLEKLNKEFARFQKSSLRSFHFFSILGIFIGLKACDLLFYNPTKISILRQNIEEEFWKTNGFPQHLKGTQVESKKRPGQKRMTWIPLELPKDQTIKTDFS